MPRPDLPANDEPALASPDQCRASAATDHRRIRHLPRQLKRIASYMSQQSERIMVDRISDIARECEVHPSAIVRFSQRFGFSGFSEMQALFRTAYTHKASPVHNYQQRIRSMIANQSQQASDGDLARECIDATRSGIERLGRELDDVAFEKAVDLIVNADNIYVVGVRRSFAVADYLVYNLQHTHKRIHLVSGLGGSYREQMRSVRSGDLVIAISFTPTPRKPSTACATPANNRPTP
jgi:DNA-binding MurR/RpiR family transcriptional regulator